MSGKYMKTKRIIIPTITMVIIASQLFGCASASKEESLGMLQNSDSIEIELAEPEYDINAEVTLLPWLQLAQLETHPELRTAFEEQLGITINEDGTKSGILYTNGSSNADQNNTLANSTIPAMDATGYDSHLLEERTTDKGYKVFVDTTTGTVYYSGMMLPNGSIYCDGASMDATANYMFENDLNTVFDITYAEFQSLLGTVN